MIKSITFQGNRKFAANLYALEIKSRFIDQTHADGYYSGYGSELEAKVVGNQIQIGTGAFVVQGRISEVVSTEVVTPTIYDNFVGYVVARIETYHVSDDNNCTFKAYVNTALSEIPLRQDDVYATNADNENLVYELPIYSFEIKDRTIVNLQKLIKPIDDYARVQKEIEQIQQSIQEALAAVQTASENLELIAQGASDSATSAVEAATSANTNAANAETSASKAALTAKQAIEKVNDLEGKVKAGGTVVEVAGVAQIGMSFKKDPQLQIDEINKQLENGVGGSAYKGDLPDDESIMEEILFALTSEHHLIYRVPQGYDLNNVAPFFEESNVNTELGGYVEFIGDIKILGDINSNEVEIESVNICANLVDGSGRRITDYLKLNADNMKLDRQNVLSMNQAFFRDSEAFSNDITESGVYIIRISGLKIADGLYINPTPFLATFIADAGDSKAIYGGGVMTFLGNLFAVSRFGDTWYIYDAQGKEYTDMEAIYCEKLV